MTIGEFSGFSSNMQDDSMLAQINGQNIGNYNFSDWGKKSIVTQVDPNLANMNLRDMLYNANALINVQLCQMAYFWQGEQKMSESYSTINMETGTELGTGFKDGYEVIQHEEVFSNFLGIDSIRELGGIPTRIVNVKDGKQVIIQVLLPESFYTQTSEHKLFLNLWNAHDGKMGWGVNSTDFRIVCQNTRAMALKSKVARYFGKHTKNAREKMTDIASALGIIRQDFGEYGKIMNSFENRLVNSQEINDFLLYLIPDGENKSDNRKKNVAPENRRNELKQFILNGTGQPETPSYYSLYNGVNEYVDNRVQNRDEKEQFMFALFGTGQQMKDKAYNYLLK